MNPPPAVPVATALDTMPPVRLDANGMVADDISCRRCGYNLRSLSPAGRCPECGTAVGRSLRGDLLQFSDPQWVDKLASGMNWIVASIVVGVFSGAILAIVIGMLGAFGNPTIIFVAAPAMQLGLGAVALIGYWKVTTPDPAKLEPEDGLSARKIVRASQIANYALAPIVQVLLPIAFWTSQGLNLLSTLIGLAGMFAIFIYARSLAIRVPDEQLARHCRIVMWGLAVMMSLSFVVAVIAVFSAAPGAGAGMPVIAGAPLTSAPAAGQANPAAGSPAANPALNLGGGTATTTTATTTTTAVMPFGPAGTVGGMAVACALGLGFFIFGIWSLILIIRFRRALSKAAASARASWASPHFGQGPAVIPPRPSP